MLVERSYTDSDCLGTMLDKCGLLREQMEEIGSEDAPLFVLATPRQPCQSRGAAETLSAVDLVLDFLNYRAPLMIPPDVLTPAGSNFSLSTFEYQCILHPLYQRIRSMRPPDPEFSLLLGIAYCWDVKPLVRFLATIYNIVLAPFQDDKTLVENLGLPADEAGPPIVLVMSTGKRKNLEDDEEKELRSDLSDLCQNVENVLNGNWL